MEAHLVSFQHHKARSLSILLRDLLGFHSLGELQGRGTYSEYIQGPGTAYTQPTTRSI